MPPRIPLNIHLRGCQSTANPNFSRSFSASTPVSASTSAHREKHRDPYAIAQARARKAANLSRQEVLKKERAAVLGDPVRGTTTPFVKSFDTGVLESSKSPDGTPSQAPLNFSLTEELLSQSIERSQWLSTSTRHDYTTDLTVEEAQEKDRQARETAAEALRRISNLDLGNNKARLLINKRRCIETFGRHNTDGVLGPRPRGLPSDTTGEASTATITPRTGPDTGSSEVQIAILTAKIRAVANGLDSRGRMDKVNKRNLRLLVHRRQKLLKYLHRKERGGPRWKNLIETLGLTEGTWKEEISM